MYIIRDMLSRKISSGWYGPADAYLGPQRVFLTILGLVGIDG